MNVATFFDISRHFLQQIYLRNIFHVAQTTLCRHFLCSTKQPAVNKSIEQNFMQAPFNAIRRTANTLSCSTVLRLSFLLVNLKRVWYFGTTAMNGCTIDAHHHAVFLHGFVALNTLNINNEKHREKFNYFSDFCVFSAFSSDVSSSKVENCLVINQNYLFPAFKRLQTMKFEQKSNFFAEKIEERVSSSRNKLWKIALISIWVITDNKIISKQ